MKQDQKSKKINPLGLELELKTRNPKQFQVAKLWFDNETEEILYGGAKGGAKSYSGAALIFADALTYPETHYFIARKELIDLRNFTIPTIHEVFKNWGLKIGDYCRYNGQDHVFMLYNKSMVHLIDCKEEPGDPLYERFGSMQMTRGWIEEGGEIAEAAKANLWLSVGRWKNEEFGLKKKLLITANPKKGWLKRDYVDPFNKGILKKGRAYIQAFATDNPYLPKDYLKTLSEDTNKVRRQRLWEGNWDYDDDDDSLTSYDAIEDAFKMHVTKDGERYITADIARKGKDRTVIGVWDGLELEKVIIRHKQPTPVTEQLIADTAAEEGVPYSHIIADEDGVGGGVVDHLPGIKGFTANSSPIPTKAQIREKNERIKGFLTPKTTYKNLKAQVGWKTAELLNEHKMAFRTEEIHDIISEELLAVLREKKVDSDGKLELKEKKRVKEDLNGKSPDVADMIMMRSWFELKSNALQGDPAEEAREQGEQDDMFERNRERASMNDTQ